MQGMFCANSQCQKHTVKSGGRFIYSQERRDFFCEDCFHVPLVMNDCSNRWEFVTTHFNGQPIQVKGLNHLRQLEKEFGVSSHAANYEERNWSTPPPIKPMPLHPKLAELLGAR